MLYYGIITLCALMFSSQFFFNQLFQKEYGSDLKAVLVCSAGSAVAGIAAMLLINGAAIGITTFSLIMACVNAVNGMAFNFCSLKAFGKINLSLYSVFSMLGGMALPFAAGILFFGEEMTLAKAICFVMITAALALTVEKERGRSGLGYYIGIFVLNGMAGIISMIHQSAPFETVNAAEYSLLSAAVTLIFSLIALLVCRGEKRPLHLKAVLALGGNGLLNRVANWLLLISLTVLPASAQYPFITGGTMVFSFLISVVTRQKPGKRELLSIALAFVGLLILVLT